jgi:MscS family membrane protein
MLIAFAFGLSAGRAWIWLPVSIEDALAIAVKALAITGFLWLWWRLSGHLARGIARMFGASGDARGEATDVVRKGLRLLGIAVALLVIAEFVFDTDVSVFLTGVGVISIAASVAAQDTLRNLMASVTIHSDRPFVLGDLIRFKDELGHIEEIGFRSTRLRTLDGPVVVIPNGELVRESIVNLSARTHIRHHYAIDLVYGTSPDRMQEAVGILQEILESRDYRDGQEPHVSFDAYGEYSLRIELWYTSKTGDYFEAKRERDEVNRQILGRFGEAGLEFAFPTRTLQFESVAASAGRPESAEGETGEAGDVGGGTDERDDASVSDESETAAVGRN